MIGRRGRKVFCGGGNRRCHRYSHTIVDIVESIEDVSSKNPEDLRSVSEAGERSMKDMEELRKPVDDIRIYLRS